MEYANTLDEAADELQGQLDLLPVGTYVPRIVEHKRSLQYRITNLRGRASICRQEYRKQCEAAGITP